MKIETPSAVHNIICELNEHGHEAYAVGGAVRDALLGRMPKDWDITTNASPVEVKSIFNRTIDTGIQHGTVTVMIDRVGYEVTTYRIDGEYEDSRHPKEVQFTRNLKEDLLRRDFTINALAYNSVDGVVDEFGGLEDLEAGIIRCVGDPYDRFTEDALRMLRAIRFSAQLGFQIEEETKAAIKKLAPTIVNISAERVRDELLKLIESDNPGHIRLLYELGLTRYILPEFDRMMECEQNSKHHMYDVGNHTIKSMESIRADRVLRLTMLMHDMGKPECKTTDVAGYDHFKGHPAKSADIADKILRRLKLDNATRIQVVRLVRYHDERPSLKQVKVRRKIVEMGKECFPVIFEVNRADTMAQSDYKRQEKLGYIQNYQDVYEQIVEEGQCLSVGELEIAGADLIRMGVKQGPDIGRILKELFEEVLSHPDKNNAEYLTMRAEQLLHKD